MSRLDIVQISRQWWEELNALTEASDYLTKRDQDVQFLLADDRSFYIRFQQGKAAVMEGLATPDIYRVLNLETSRESLMAMYRGHKSFADLIIEEKLFAHEMSKRATITWVGKVIRLRKELGSPLCI